MRAEDAILAEERRLRAFVTQLLDDALDRNVDTGLNGKNAWRQQRPMDEAPRWCLYSGNSYGMGI